MLCLHSWKHGAKLSPCLVQAEHQFVILNPAELQGVIFSRVAQRATWRPRKMVCSGKLCYFYLSAKPMILFIDRWMSMVQMKPMIKQ